MTTKQAMKQLVKALNKDEDYRRSWKANIAMAFYDEYRRREHTKVLNDRFVLSVANDAADNFLDILTRDNADA